MALELQWWGECILPHQEAPQVQLKCPLQFQYQCTFSTLSYLRSRKSNKGENRSEEMQVKST